MKASAKMWLSVFFCLLLLAGCGTPHTPEETVVRPTAAEPEIPAAVSPETQIPVQRLVITFAGDCTLGNDPANDYNASGFRMTVGEDYGYPFRNVEQWFSQDDLTIVNLEGVLGDRGAAGTKRFNFRGSADYVKILTEHSVEAVSLANNHTLDFGEAGYEETRRILEDAGIVYVEQNSGRLILLENGITVGIYGTVYNTADQAVMEEGIRTLKEQGADLVIYAAHWGQEYFFQPNDQQKQLGRAAIDAGADIVYGTHPHVLQPIEEYGDGVIFYSLGNFSFGGNTNPADYDTALIRQEVILGADGNATLGERTVVPCSVSSQESRNDYQPAPVAEGSEAYHRILRKLDGSYEGHSLQRR